MRNSNTDYSSLLCPLIESALQLSIVITPASFTGAGVGKVIAINGII